jgi:hypothetical protein
MSIHSRLALFIMTLLIVAPAFAESTTEMLSSCREVAEAPVKGDKIAMTETFQTGWCWGSFGVVQKIIVRADSTGRPFFRICAPPESTRSQLIAVFVEYARRNPQRLHEDFFDVALEALRGAFPCPP